MRFYDGSKGGTAALNPEKTEAMIKAFQDAWQALKDSGDVLATDFRAPSTREALAKSLVKLAQAGEADPIRLKASAMAELLTKVPRM
jgi:hypothetical protein